MIISRRSGQTAGTGPRCSFGVPGAHGCYLAASALMRQNRSVEPTRTVGAIAGLRPICPLGWIPTGRFLPAWPSPSFSRLANVRLPRSKEELMPSGVCHRVRRATRQRVSGARPPGRAVYLGRRSVALGAAAETSIAKIDRSPGAKTRASRAFRGDWGDGLLICRSLVRAQVGSQVTRGLQRCGPFLFAPNRRVALRK